MMEGGRATPGIGEEHLQGRWSQVRPGLPFPEGERPAPGLAANHLVDTVRLRLGVTYEKGVTLGNVTMSHRTRERPAECLASLSHSTMIGLPRAQH
ncbi:hypothetical protein EVAR_34179_1 [Eumeta japonica]|uniref:Uncharacterized protein n=1 Tax=Eumeta variegata TaxID=151549 RepID=A0A4C1WHM0_EUMVA|nr:hypothetical protein EVAR_34179_1 [Eumeta japonica]